MITGLFWASFLRSGLVGGVVPAEVCLGYVSVADVPVLYGRWKQLSSQRLGSTGGMSIRSSETLWTMRSS